MEQCSICLESLDGGGVVALACNHRFHAAWRWFGSRKDAAKAFGGVSPSDICKLIKDPSKETEHARETFEARPARAAPPKKRKRPAAKKPRFVQRCVEGAKSKANGKWANSRLFPGREFDDLDAYRAAKKQRKERRAAYADNYLR